MTIISANIMTKTSGSQRNTSSWSILDRDPEFPGDVVVVLALWSVTPDVNVRLVPVSSSCVVPPSLNVVVSMNGANWQKQNKIIRISYDIPLVLLRWQKFATRSVAVFFDMPPRWWCRWQISVGVKARDVNWKQVDVMVGCPGMR